MEEVQASRWVCWNLFWSIELSTDGLRGGKRRITGIDILKQLEIRLGY
jgi:hypothetical protein